ncbi:MAG TPA: hypothetical protein VHM89_13440 [Acidimicrobiales bacterium]|nr:hypothetical protein [Acidimicrobiales bacterium]
MSEPAKPRTVVVAGADGAAVAEEVRRRRAAGQRAAGYVGDDPELATTMGQEMLGAVDQLVRLPDP